MIEIKRSCNSSVRNDPEKSTMSFNVFNIKLTGEDYDLITDIMLELNLKAVDALQAVIDAGLIYIEQQIDPDYHEEWQPKGMIE